MAFEEEERVNLVVTFDPLLVSPQFIAEVVGEIEGVEDVAFDPAH